SADVFDQPFGIPRGVLRILRHPADRRSVLGIDEDVAELRIGGRAAPVGAAGESRENDRGFRIVAVGVNGTRRGRTLIVQTRAIPKFQAGFGMVGSSIRGS